MEIVTPDEFARRTLGGRPNRLDVTIYDGCEYQCACGEVHVFRPSGFEPSETQVLRELPWMRLVLACPLGEDAATCVKIRGWFKYRFQSLFGTTVETDKPPEINATTAKIDEQVYLMNYRDHYADILADQITPSRLAELFLFRAWTAQFGYRIFSSDAEASEKLIGETVNASKYLGLGMFQQVHGFAVEIELESDFISLIEERWRDYDVVVSTMPNADRLPTMEIITVLTNRLDVAEPEVTCRLSMDFLVQMDLIKRTAMEIGILRK